MDYGFDAKESTSPELWTALVDWLVANGVNREQIPGDYVCVMVKEGRIRFGGWALNLNRKHYMCECACPYEWRRHAHVALERIELPMTVPPSDALMALRPRRVEPVSA